MICRVIKKLPIILAFSIIFPLLSCSDAPSVTTFFTTITDVPPATTVTNTVTNTVTSIPPVITITKMVTSTPVDGVPTPTDFVVTGGLLLTYQADVSNVDAKDVSAMLDQDIAVIYDRLQVLGIFSPAVLKRDPNRITVEILLDNNDNDVEKYISVIGATAVLEFGEQVTDTADPAIKWKDSLGSWKPALGMLNGQLVELTSAYFQDNANVTTNMNGQVILIFKLNLDGSTLIGQITQRLIQKPLGIFFGDQPLMGADGHIIAPTVQAQITDEGEVTGLDVVDAKQLAKLMNAGSIPVPLTLIEKQKITN